VALSRRYKRRREGIPVSRAPVVRVCALAKRLDVAIPGALAGMREV